MTGIDKRLSDIIDELVKEFPTCGFILASTDSTNGEGEILVEGTFRGESAILLADQIKKHVFNTVAEQSPEVLLAYIEAKKQGGN